MIALCVCASRGQSPPFLAKHMTVLSYEMAVLSVSDPPPGILIRIRTQDKKVPIR